MIGLIFENTPVAANVWRMKLRATCRDFYPGMFLNLSVPGLYLRRPFAIAACNGDELTFYYKTVGTGTETMTSLSAGCEVDILAPLGIGFSNTGNAPLLVGGGAGVGPLYALAKSLVTEGKPVTVALGFNTAEDIYLADEFRTLGCSVHLTTIDGTRGTKGLVTDVLHDITADYFYTCGPTPMMQAVCKTLSIPGEVSLEERMACGFGACVGCAVQTVEGMRRVCKDGPVFKREVLSW